MMKKLMVLSLVLAMGTLASAGLVLINNTPSQAAVVSDNAQAYGIWLAVDSSLVVEIAVDSTKANPNGDSVFEDWGLDSGQVWYFLSNRSLAPVSPLSPGQHVLITAISGEGFVDMWDGNLEGIIGRAQLVPEPMTMGLLGLGALFLRRRK
jgi:hypothetical protein